jgi:hypothetical protein
VDVAALRLGNLGAAGTFQLPRVLRVDRMGGGAREQSGGNGKRKLVLHRCELFVDWMEDSASVLFSAAALIVPFACQKILILRRQAARSLAKNDLGV